MPFSHGLLNFVLKMSHVSFINICVAIVKSGNT